MTDRLDHTAIALDDQDTATLLQGFARFGVDLGLDRVCKLLHDLGDPQQRVPMVHVAGTNGKGSVCAYLSSVLTAAGYRVGRYTSPHLVSWHERICINQQPIAEAKLKARLHQVIAAIDPASPIPTQFEVITAAAWLHFAAENVDIAVMEVGLGGRLDATNVCDRPLVSVITPISRDHWQRLGPTLSHIATEKAGILKPQRPAVIAPQVPAVHAVISAKLAACDCPVVWVQSATEDNGRLTVQTELGIVTYTLKMLGDHQRVNSAVAIAAIQQLQQQGWQITHAAIQTGMAAAQWPGRLQWLMWPTPQGEDLPLLIDGAHNAAAAAALRPYVDRLLAAREAAQISAAGVTWVMGMLATKDHRDIFQALLRPGDSLHLVPVPGHLSESTENLAAIAQAICPHLIRCQQHSDVFTALASLATPEPAERPALTVLCGSLYLIGDMLKTLNSKT